MRNDLSISILRAVKNYTAEHMFPPSIRDIKDMTNYGSTSGIYTGLRKLEKQEYIIRQPAKARSTILTEKGRIHLDVVERL